MFKIGEFSKLVRVSARMLRYYDKCGLLHPVETDRFTGYRRYSATQIPLLTRIAALRDMGFGVEEIENILPYFDDATTMKKVLEQKSQEIYSTIAVEQSKLVKIADMGGTLGFISELHVQVVSEANDQVVCEANDKPYERAIDLGKERVKVVYEVELKSLKAEKVLSLREIISPDKETVLWEKLGQYMEQNNIVCIAGGYSIYHDDEYEDGDADVEIAVPVSELIESKDGFVYKELPTIPQAATIRFSGPYEGYTAAMEKLASWVEQNGYVFDGLMRGLAIASPSDVKSPEDYMTELQVPVRKA